MDQWASGGPGPVPGLPEQRRPVPRLVGPPPGSRYHRLAATALHRWWRPIAGTLLVVAGFLAGGAGVYLVSGVVAALAGVPVPATGGRVFGDPVLELAALLLSVATLLPAVYGAAWLVQRRPPGTLSSVAGRLRRDWLLVCTGTAVGCTLLGHAGMLLVMVLTGEEVGDLFGWVGWAEFLPALPVVLLLVPVQAAAEEYAFRGWLLQAFGAYLRTPWPGILIGAAVFTALHAYTGWGIADVFAFGVLMGWLAVRTGGLEAPIALHTVNNVLVFLPSAAAGDLDETLRQGAVPWQSLVGTVLQLATFAAITVILLQKRAILTESQ